MVTISDLKRNIYMIFFALIMLEGVAVCKHRDGEYICIVEKTDCDTDDRCGNKDTSQCRYDFFLL